MRAEEERMMGPMTEERRMISVQLGEKEEDWLEKERQKLKKLHALPPIRKGL